MKTTIPQLSQILQQLLIEDANSQGKQVFHLLAALPHFAKLLHTLRLILPTLACCVIQKRKARPATFQMLERASP